jgi:hypothetical protein
MHFHLPKPLHGWRAFVGEVGIIVLGVLIALGAEQAVEAGHWHEKVGVVRKSLTGELANDRARWEWDVAYARCAMAPIDALDAWARAGAKTAPPGKSMSFFGLTYFSMHSANWSLATGSGTLDHFPVEEQLAFAALYDGIGHRQLEIQTASDLTYRVQTLTPLAGDVQGRRELRAALGVLKLTFEALASNDAYMRRHFDAVGVKPDRRDFAADLDNAAPCAN